MPVGRLGSLEQRKDGGNFRGPEMQLVSIAVLERAAGVVGSDQIDREDTGCFQVAGGGELVAADDLGVVDADQIDGGARAACRSGGPGRSWRCRPRTRTVRPAGCNSSSSPTATLPEATVPVTTVPWPATVNERSIAMRKSPGSVGGLARRGRPIRGRLSAHRAQLR